MQEPVNAVKAKLTVELDESLHRMAKSKSALEGGSLASVVRGLLAEWVGLAEPESREALGVATPKPPSGSASPFVPSKPVKCELRNPAVPSQKCGLELGHAGDHVFA